MTGYSIPDFDPGFSINPDVLTLAECDSLISALSSLRRGRAGVRHLMGSPAVASLAQDARLLSIARPALGTEAVPFRATLFEKSGKANWLVAWHQDTALPLKSHLDASTSENGPLRVIAGSHSAGVPTDAQVIDFARTHPSTACPAPRCGVLAMRPLIIHASSKARDQNPRRVLHIEYADTLDLAPGIRLAIA